MDGKRKLRSPTAIACFAPAHASNPVTMQINTRRNRAQGYAHQDRARTLGNGYRPACLPA